MIPADPFATDVPRTPSARRRARAIVTAIAVAIVLGIALLFANPIVGALLSFDAY
jgi:hypothetical protein